VLHMRIVWVAQYHGPNPLAPGPVVVAELAAAAGLDALRVSEATALVWAQSKMQAPDSQPDLSADASSTDGVLQLALAAARWAQAALNEIRGDVLHAGARRAGDRVRIWLGFHRAALSRDAVHLALRSLGQALNGQLDAKVLSVELDRLWTACRRHHPDYQARILMAGARDMDLPYLPFLPGSKFWQFGWGTHGQVFLESASNADGALGNAWQRNKVTTKEMMRAIGMPTAAHVLISDANELLSAVKVVGYPCVVKPLDKGGGKGVTANISHAVHLQEAFAHARSYTQGAVMVEAHLSGLDHRLMVINGQFVAAIRREPSFVTGDGQKTIAELLADLNAPRSGNMVKSRYLRRIPMEDVLIQHLAEQSLTLSDVPCAGQCVTLRSNANLSTGGICTDVTAQCHPQLQAMAVQLARSFGLFCVGIDYLTSDISRSPQETGGAFIELNCTPGLDACIAAGWSQESIARLVLSQSLGRIPVRLTVLHPTQIANVLTLLATTELEEHEALVCKDVLRVGSLALTMPTPEPWAAVMAALRNRGVNSLHVICSSDDIAQHGLPLDSWDEVQVALRDGATVLSPTWMQVMQRHTKNDVISVVQEDMFLRPQRFDNSPITTGVVR
jgi:cyanophycin synthetase